MAHSAPTLGCPTQTLQCGPHTCPIFHAGIRAHSGLPTCGSIELSVSPSPQTQTSQWQSSISLPIGQFSACSGPHTGLKGTCLLGCCALCHAHSEDTVDYNSTTTTMTRTARIKGNIFIKRIKPSTHYLKASPVPRCVSMSGPLQVSKLDLISSIWAAHLHRELHLQKLMWLFPVHLETRYPLCFKCFEQSVD